MHCTFLFHPPWGSGLPQGGVLGRGEGVPCLHPGGVLGQVGVSGVSVFMWSGGLIVLGGVGVAGGVFV